MSQSIDARRLTHPAGTLTGAERLPLAQGTVDVDALGVVALLSDVVGFIESEQLFLSLAGGEVDGDVDVTGDVNVDENVNCAGTVAAQSVTTNTLRVNATGGAPSGSGSPSPTGFVGGGNTMLTEPDKWIKIKGDDGNFYVLPGFTPGT
ncbi:MAG TPA: hypothetical protein VGF13_20640 [Verrucomicrobiae bacterium]|jgi:hypothetical protein